MKSDLQEKIIVLFFLIFFIPLSCKIFSDNNLFSLKKAIDISLKHNNSILINREIVKSSEGELSISKSKFDTVIDATTAYQHSETPVTDVLQTQTNTVSGNLNITKTFRTGISSGLSLSTTRVENISSPVKPTTQTTISFSLTIPLLEGLGIEHAASDELSSKSKLKETKLQLLHTISKTIYQTTIYYWNYLLAVKNLRVFQESFERTEKILEQVKILIEKNFRPKADVEQILASVSNKKAKVFDAEQKVISAKNQLAIFLGLEPENFKIITTPTTDFPEISFNEISNIIMKKDKILSQSLNNRYDYLSSLQSEKTAKINLVSAIDKLKNTLKLSVKTSYKRLKIAKYPGAMIDAFWRERPGFNVNLLLTYKWPLKNSYAKGLVTSYQAILKQNILNTKQLKRSIYSNIETAISDLEKSYNNFIQSKSSVTYYKKSIFNERKKYRLGMSTIIDVINIEDRLTTANLNEISASYRLAVAIVKLRYETGRLIKTQKGENRYEFNIKNVLTLFRK